MQNCEGFYLFWRFPLLSEQGDFSVVDFGKSAHATNGELAAE